jgi:hypothetical protein
MNYADALQEAKRLSDLSDDNLFHELGVRLEDAKRSGAQQRQQQYSGDFSAAENVMGSEALLQEIGRRWWLNLEPELMRIVCDPNNKEIEQVIGNKSIPALAAGLAVSALAALAAPSVVIVISSILALKISEAGLKAVCEAWSDRIKTRRGS